MPMPGPRCLPLQQIRQFHVFPSPDLLDEVPGDREDTRAYEDSLWPANAKPDATEVPAVVEDAASTALTPPDRGVTSGGDAAA